MEIRWIRISDFNVIPRIELKNMDMCRNCYRKYENIDSILYDRKSKIWKNTHMLL